MPQLKDIEFWDWDYLPSLPSGEFDWLDYKASGFLEKKNESDWLARMSEYLSAYSNYGGGYLIIGMKESQTGTYLPDECIQLTHRKYRDYKDWLEDKLPGTVNPPLPNITVQVIRNPDDSDRGVIAIYVPASDKAPHQGAGGKFYARLGSKNRILSTQEIFDIEGRRRHPELTGYLTIHIRDKILDRRSRLNLEIENTSKILCRHFGARILVPIYFRNWFLHFGEGFHVNSEKKQSWVISIPQSGPIFPLAKMTFPIDFDSSQPPKQSFESSDVIELRLFADEAPYKDLEFAAADVVKLP